MRGSIFTQGKLNSAIKEQTNFGYVMADGFEFFRITIQIFNSEAPVIFFNVIGWGRNL